MRRSVLDDSVAKVIFTSDLQRFTGGVREAEVAAGSYQQLVAELQQRFPGLTDVVIGKYGLAIDGAIIQTPLLERFGHDSELVFVTRIAGG
jgi:hypothetical protein